MKATLPHGWTVKKSSEFCLRVADGTHDTPKPTADGHPLITSKNLKNGRIQLEGAYNISTHDFDAINKRSKVDQWDVLFSMIGTVGEMALARTKPHYAIKNIGLFKSRGRDDGIWLYYYLTSPVGQAALDTFLSGTSQQFVALGDLRKIPIISPTPKSKRKIAAILTAYDDLIETNKRRIALLEKTADELYREWFVRMRFPGHQNAKFAKGVPEGWERSPIGELTSVLSRGISPKYSVESARIVINQKCIRDGDIKWNHAKTHNSSVPEKKVLKDGDILVNSTGVGTLGRSAILWDAGSDLVCDSHVTICRADPEKVAPLFLGFAVRLLRSYFDYLAVGATGQTELNQSFISKTRILVPTRNLQDQFQEACFPQLDLVHKLRKAIDTLTQTRDLLLPRLISGKLSVESLDIQFPPSMQEASAEPAAAHA